MTTTWIVAITGLLFLVIILGLVSIIRSERIKYSIEISRVYSELERYKKSQNTAQRSVIKGQLAEQFYPLMGECTFHPSDMRFMGDFCDYIVIDGYTKCKDEGDDYIRDIVFVEIKTGKAQLSRHQKLIRSAVEQGRVRWETVNIN